jgi:hypothetical protein
VDARCTVKNEKVKISKPRRCEHFVMEHEKVPLKRKLPAKYVPFHLRDKDAYKAAVKEHNKQAEDQNLQNKLDALKNPDILSRFRSTAGEK